MLDSSTMSRYHINPQTGMPGICRATKACPFGHMETDHYPTATAARAAFEASAVGNHMVGLQKPLPSVSVPMATVLDLDELNRDLAEGFIDMREHEADDSLKILCYSNAAQISGHWTEACKVARGLIAQGQEADFSDAVILQRPWRKFFTLDQLSNGSWVLGDEEREGESVEAELAKIDFNARAEVTDKMDGSLGILYVHPDGRPALSTKGSFGSEQAISYTSMLRNGPLGEQAAELLRRHPDTTFLFELVGRDNRIVLDYEEDGIVMLGAVRKTDGLYLSATDFQESWAGGVTETMPAHTVGEALALPDRENREGVVIRVLSDDPGKQMQLKVKQDDYKMLHRAVSGHSKSDMRTAIRDSEESFEELLAVAKSGDATQLKGVASQLELLKDHALLKDVYDERAAVYQELVMPRLKRLEAAKDYVDSLPESFFQQENPAKVFAQSIAGRKDMDSTDLFSLFRERLTGQADSRLPVNVLKSIAKLI